MVVVKRETFLKSWPHSGGNLWSVAGGMLWLVVFLGREANYIHVQKHKTMHECGRHEGET